MATNKLSIANQALAMLGQDPTETLTLQDARAPTRRLVVFMDQALDEVLNHHFWTDAQRHPELTAVAAAEGDADWKYPYVYKLPSDVLRVVGVEGGMAWQQATRANGAAEERIIRSANPGPLQLTCIARIGWEVLPTHLVTPVAARLAALACFAVTGDQARARDLVKASNDALYAALGKDALQEGGQAPLFDDPYARLRASAG